MYNLRNFFSLGMMQPTRFKKIEGFTDEDPLASGVQISYGFSNYISETAKLRSYDMLFTYADLSENLDSYLQRWFDSAEQIQPVHDLYFGVSSSQNVYLVHAFLSIVQAVEIYHKRSNARYELSEPDLTNLKEDILANPHNRIGADPRSKMYTKKHLNRKDPRLIIRILELTRPYTDVLYPFIQMPVDFAFQVVKTRNHYTHNSAIDDDTAKGDELYKLTEKLKLLMQICLLSELGFGVDKISAVLNRNKGYRLFLASIASDRQHLVRTSFTRLQ
jgi:hypothetical protein